MDANQLASLRERYASGEKVTKLAKEAGLSWQFLWGLLNGGENKQPPQHSRRTSRRASGQAKSGQPVTMDGDGIHRITFGSVGESVIDALADYAQNESNRQLIATRVKEHLTGDDSWANNFTHERLMSTIANPPKELVDAVESMRNTLIEDVCPPASSRRRVRRNQEDGDELNPEQVLTRSLTPWERMTRETTPKRMVTIGVNLTVHAGRKAEHLLWRGAAAVALADILTQRGVNVEVVGFWTIGDMSSMVGKVVSRYVVKSSDMPLDVGAASVALAEIAYARLIALYGLARHIPGRLHSGLGHCQSLPEQDRVGIDYLAENIISREEAESWLRLCVRQQESGVLHV